MTLKVPFIKCSCINYNCKLFNCDVQVSHIEYYCISSHYAVRKNLAPSFLKCFLADPIEKQENIEMSDPNSEKEKAKPAQPPKKEPSRVN